MFTLPEHFWLTERTTATDDPAPSLRPHYRGFITTTGRSASAPRRRYSCPYGALPARALPLPSRTRAADRAHATSAPDTAWPVGGHPPGSSRNTHRRPGSDVI